MPPQIAAVVGMRRVRESRNLSEWDSNGWHVTSPAPRDAWEEIVVSDPRAYVFYSHAWVACLPTGVVGEEIRPVSYRSLQNTLAVLEMCGGCTGSEI